MKLRLNIQDKKRGKKVTDRGSTFKRLRSSRLFTFLLFVLLAFVFWFSQSLQNNITRRLLIPLGHDSLSLSRGLSAKFPEYLELQVQDRVYAHAQYALLGFDTIQLRYNRDASGNEYIGLGRKALIDAIAIRLSSTARIVQQSHHELNIPLYKRVSKTVPIRAGFNLKSATGLTALSPQFLPDSVTIYGSSQVLSGVDYIKTQDLDEQELTTSIDKKIGLVMPQDVYADMKQTQVRITVEELTEQSYSLPIVVYNAPEGYTLSPLPSMATVMLTVPRSRFSDLSESALELSIDYNELPKTSDNAQVRAQLPIRLSKAPLWIVNHRLRPETVQFVLEAKP